MSAVRQWVGGFIIVAGTVTIAPRVMAQQEGTTPDSVPLAARVDELEQQIRVLKRLRELEGDSIAAAAKDKAVGHGEREGRLQHQVGRRQVRPQAPRLRPGRRPLLRRRRSQGRAQHLLPAPCPADRRGHGREVLRLPHHARFRPGPDGALRRLRRRQPDARLRGSAWASSSRRSGSSGCSRPPTSSSPSAVCRPTWCPTGTSASSSGATSTPASLTYAVGVFNGVVDLGNGDGDLNDSKDLDARVFLQPFTQGSLKGLGFGIAATTGTEQGGLSGTTLSSGLPSYRSPGQQTVFRYRVDAAAPLNSVIADGQRSRLVPQGYFYSGPFGLQGEYALSRQEVRLGPSAAELTHKAWQASGSFFLTGEKAGFRSPDAQEGLRSQGEGLRRPGAGRAVRRARRRRRRLPHLRQSDRARSPRRRARASASTGT